MKTEVFVILQHCYLQEDPNYGSDWIEETQGYVFEDYEKARYWALGWVKEFNNTCKKTEHNESGEFANSDEPVMKEVSEDVWACFSADIEIFRVGEIALNSFETKEAVENLYLS
ncbi:MAG TPA: hypothetical protein VN922_12750 [Bacteroidia bacterium]|nr:hypothetical protein [Bacteroidia bacterium]